MSGRIERDVHSFIPSFEYQSRRLTGDRGFIDLSIFHPPSRGSRQRSGRYTEFPGTHAYVHVDTHTHTHTYTYDRRAHELHTRTANVSSVCGEPGYIPLVSIIPSPRSVLPFYVRAERDLLKATSHFCVF